MAPYPILSNTFLDHNLWCSMAPSVTHTRAELMEMQILQATGEFLREMEILSDTEGRYIYHLARRYIHA